MAFGYFTVFTCC